LCNCDDFTCVVAAVSGPLPVVLSSSAMLFSVYLCWDLSFWPTLTIVKPSFAVTDCWLHSSEWLDLFISSLFILLMFLDTFAESADYLSICWHAWFLAALADSSLGFYALTRVRPTNFMEDLLLLQSALIDESTSKLLFSPIWEFLIFAKFNLKMAGFLFYFSSYCSIKMGWYSGACKVIWGPSYIWFWSTSSIFIFYICSNNISFYYFEFSGY